MFILYLRIMQNFEQRLSGGHPNSLGNTVEVTDEVLAANEHFDELFNCYFSEDEIVRLRTSSAMKRICQSKKELLLPYLDRFLTEISQIDQPSTKWTLAILFGMLKENFTLEQFAQAKAIIKKNLVEDDWIVLNYSMETLFNWSKDDEKLKTWLLPHLERLQKDSRKSVAKRASKLMEK